MADLDKRSADVSIHNSTSDAAVTTTTDGSKERLDVSLGDTLSFQLQAVTPVFNFDGTTGTSLTTSWTTLVNVTGTAGKVDFIASALGSSNYKIRLTVDSVVCYDISMSELNTIGLSNAVNVEMWAETANKNYRFHPNVPIDFTDNMKVEAAMTTGTGTLYWYVQHREAV
jgi:hypothetical protein